jgi:hypothetical protein
MCFNRENYLSPEQFVTIRLKRAATLLIHYGMVTGSYL